MDGPTWRSRIAPVELPPVFVDDEALRVAERHARKPAVIDALTGRSLSCSTPPVGSPPGSPSTVWAAATWCR